MLDKVQADRLAKLEQVRQLGVDPYGGRYDTAQPIADVLACYEAWEARQGGAEGVKAAMQPAEGEPLRPLSGDAAGRIILLRDMGKMIFAHIRDQSGQMQICLRKDQGKEPRGLGETLWKLAKLLDLGDIVAVRGQVIRTRTGEVTIWADTLTLLCKSLNPMPEKWHGLTDTETRYRQRYLDLMANPDSLKVFQDRIAILDSFRRVLTARQFVEVETPVLQPIYGGAAARPFTTHHNTLDCELFLRISPELYLKRLLVGGMQRVYEFSRNFRNEGIDTRHNPEFTLLELYQAYADYEVMMEITEELITTAAKKMLEAAKDDLLKRRTIKTLAQGLVSLNLTNRQLSDKQQEKATAKHEGMSEADHLLAECVELMDAGRTALPYGSKNKVDFTTPWPRRTYDSLMVQHAGMSMKDIPAVRAKARQLGIEESNKDDAVVVNEVFEAVVEPALARPDENGVLRPVFVMDYPAELCPLTRRKADDPSIALRFECFIAGMEVANAYSELNDPAVQEANFAEQVRGEAEGETMRVMDEDFVTALRHGMPPAGGLGIGMDRVIMLLTNRTSIRDVILFPLLRPL
ncbi:MAG: Lysine--tRNA ligase [Planctomycetes bacterium ADurb.Bin126]|nr:MAG: Lysine--tRNA ligase [Planctomycetes bacterium ADurb.Bin126]HQL73983.1 lysine--tRNA ligase [Phycisphaerae bacterium]